MSRDCLGGSGDGFLSDLSRPSLRLFFPLSVSCGGGCSNLRFAGRLADKAWSSLEKDRVDIIFSCRLFVTQHPGGFVIEAASTKKIFCGALFSRRSAKTNRVKWTWGNVKSFATFGDALKFAREQWNTVLCDVYIYVVVQAKDVKFMLDIGDFIKVFV